MSLFRAWSTFLPLLAVACGSAPPVVVPGGGDDKASLPRLELRDDHSFRLVLRPSDSPIDLRWDVSGIWYAAGRGMFMLSVREMRGLHSPSVRDVAGTLDGPEPGTMLLAVVDPESVHRDGAWRTFEVRRLQTMVLPRVLSGMPTSSPLEPAPLCAALSGRSATRRDAAMVLGTRLAAQIVDGSLQSYDGAKQIWHLQLEAPEVDRALDPFIYWASEFEDALDDDRRKFCTEAILGSARGLCGDPS